MKPLNTEYVESAPVKQVGVDNRTQQAEATGAAKAGYWIGFGFGLIFLGATLWARISKKNNLNKQQVAINEMASNIDVQLKNRRDTLIKLVDAVKGSVKFEKETLTGIAEMRSGNITDANRAKVDAQIENISRKVNFQVEAYPDLKSTQAIQQLMRASYDVEQDLAATRRLYNSKVTSFNQIINTWPTNVVAASMGLATLPLFQATAEDRQDVKVEF